MATKKKMDLLTAVEQIVDKAKGSGLSSEFYRKADKYIKYMSDSLLITTARNCNRKKHAELGSDCKLFTDGVGSKGKCRIFAKSSRIMDENKIIIYTDETNSIQLEVRMEREMVWVTRQQLAMLFERDYKTISKHINNALKEELADEVVVAKFANTTRHGAIEDKTQTHEKEYFNLEMVTSVGYRVKSKRGIQFRKWANKILKDYLIKGYAVNERMRKDQIGELRLLVGMLGRAVQSQPLLSTDEMNALFEVVTDYTYALDTLDNYDYERLTIEKTTKEEPFHATYENAMEEIRRLREKFGGSVLFGNEKDDSFKSSIGQIYQTFGGEELYPSVEEKAAMLLYLVTKNHSFSDGNKRIAATLFLWFLNNNGILYRKDGSKRIADNTLVALTLMIAESKTEEKDVMVKVVVNLINQRNA